MNNKSKMSKNDKQDLFMIVFMVTICFALLIFTISCLVTLILNQQLSNTDLFINSIRLFLRVSFMIPIAVFVLLFAVFLKIKKYTK